MQLIIAEKPSLGRNIVASIEEGNRDKLSKKNGYYEGEHYAVTWAFGHLFSLADIEEYSPLPQGMTHWSMDNLPCFPKEFRYHLKPGPCFALMHPAATAAAPIQAVPLRKSRRLVSICFLSLSFC